MYLITDQIILFLTDGKYTRGRNPLEVIKEENEKLNNSVVIFTFALGRGTSKPYIVF